MLCRVSNGKLETAARRVSGKTTQACARMLAVTGLALTNERRAELRALLSDDQRLNAEYPKVAEYLDMSSGLQGTGNTQADSAFDLRLVHYMTGGELESSNPYWDIVAPSVSEHCGRRVVNGGHPKGSSRLAFAEMILQATYAYAIPSPETIGWISQFAGSLPIIELGAGRGYWAGQMSRAGMVVRAYELDPPDKADNVSFPQVPGQKDVWYPVESLEVDRVNSWSDHVLFLCWPPGWGNTMASDALARFENAGGQRMIYIGEPKGGKTGDDAFFEALSARWVLDASDSNFVSWWNLADEAQGWVRR